MIRSLLLTCISCCFAIQVFAQQNDDVEHLRLMDTGVEYMNKGDYLVADRYFRMVIDEMNVLPTEICYYFGKNSFFLKKYKQSIDWLNKYIELKGVNGEFFDESVEYLELSENQYLAKSNEENTEPDVEAADAVVSEDNVGCEEGMSVVCPVCDGAGILKKPGLLGSYKYETCPYGESGVLTCEEFKLYIKGQLKAKAP